MDATEKSKRRNRKRKKKKRGRELPQKVLEFQGRYRFLSNFHPARVVFEGDEYASTEHAYQAAKTIDPEERKIILECETPGRAKRAGKTLMIREGWDDLKLSFMLELIRKKFQIPNLQKLLLATGDVELIEGNRWNDVFWGKCRGEGKNYLGEILMQVREEIRKEQE